MTDVSHAPWRLADPDGRVRDRGLDFDLIRAVAARSGWTVRVETRPGKRCLAELEAGYVDATVGLSYTPERERFLRYPMAGTGVDAQLALRTDRYRLYRLPRTPVRWDGVRLELPAGSKVGVTIGHAVAAQLRQLKADVDERARTTEMALRMVAAGEIAAAAAHQGEADALIATRPDLKGLERLPVPLEQRAYFVVFSKKFAQAHEAALPTLWGHFREASKTAAYQRAVQELSR
ncbi:substrate-binding periplasmic protein [Inhella gelatinilytica]|uniref:Transporter substrate-binding domain-containing protein n=1 Tax=Inhella gelatinilytica TaxID=2795030 RepID=A0A931IXA9_9BURK|nr:transporter substrate-binding domain-containing protein [Inhella gelatinilytica]MBH9553271.1 transporter substrate-binding domain-containing protein [Inhella gelatinilytica]